MILDDMWKIGDWESLKPAFPLHKAGSKILLTTRIQAVASHADPLQGFLYQPGLLSEEKSWELLRTKAFPRDDRREDESSQGETETPEEKLGLQIPANAYGLWRSDGKWQLLLVSKPPSWNNGGVLHLSLNHACHTSWMRLRYRLIK